MARVFRKHSATSGAKAFAFIAAVLTLLLLIWWVAENIKHSQEREEMKIVSNAITRATVQCYSLESRYPPDLEYLEKNYGLAVDRKKYIVYYQAIGRNIMPDVRLFRLED